MISMPKVQSIRRRRMNGESISSMARSENVSEPTVRKYLKAGDLSPRPPVKRKHAESVIDHYVPVIEQWLAEGQREPQRHDPPVPAQTRRHRPGMTREVREIVDGINNRPMRMLGYHTPAEAFIDELLNLQTQQGCCTYK